MIIKGLLEQEITKDIIEYKILSAGYLAKPDSNIASAILNKLYNLIYDAKLYVRIFEDMDVEDKKSLLKTLDEYYKEINVLNDSRFFNIKTTDTIFWELTNYLNAKTKEDFDRILAKVKNTAKNKEE